MSEVLTAPPPPAHGARLLAALYHQQTGRLADDPYLVSHARPKVVRNQHDVFAFYEPHLPRRGKILDWGCRHAPDSCLIRDRLGSRVELHGCDLVAPDVYLAFHEH